ncbi:MAG: hypothetical protein ACJAWS_000752 [Oleiphilaceae bacterium]|jgi:hypothetical protein
MRSTLYLAITKYHESYILGIKHEQPDTIQTSF